MNILAADKLEVLTFESKIYHVYVNCTSAYAFLSLIYYVGLSISLKGAFHFDKRSMKCGIKIKLLLSRIVDDT
jgi:hypothetical protein